MNMYKKGEETEGILHLMRLVAREYLQFCYALWISNYRAEFEQNKQFIKHCWQAE